jgi:hypothetical protein
LEVSEATHLIKALIKEGKSVDEIWPDAPATAAQKDMDARWTMKRGNLKRSEAGKIPRDIESLIRPRPGSLRS